jgi:hypothetical protein
LRFTFELDAFSVVDQPVEDGIRKGGVWNTQMPVRNGDLAGDQGGGMSEAVIDDFKNILGILDGDGITHPVIEDE